MAHQSIIIDVFITKFSKTDILITLNKHVTN